MQLLFVNRVLWFTKGIMHSFKADVELLCIDTACNVVYHVICAILHYNFSSIPFLLTLQWPVGPESKLRTHDPLLAVMKHFFMSHAISAWITATVSKVETRNEASKHFDVIIVQNTLMIICKQSCMWNIFIFNFQSITDKCSISHWEMFTLYDSTN